MGKLEKNVTQSLQPQTQQSPLNQPSSTHTRLMEHQMEIHLETWKIMITSSKTLAQDVSKNKKDGWKKIPSIYDKMLFAMNSEYGETPTNKISTQ